MFTNTLHFSLNEFEIYLNCFFFPFWLIFRVMGLTGQDFRTVGALGQEILQKRAGRAERSAKNGYNELWHLILDFWVICKDNKKREGGMLLYKDLYDGCSHLDTVALLRF